MRWGVEYEANDAGLVGLIIFSCEDIREANQYVDDMVMLHGFTRVANLREIKDGCTIADLRRLFPGYLPEPVFPKAWFK
jgi:hypothetical protein